MECPNCDKQLSERGLFCSACAAQARCSKCRALLERGGLACVECGTRVGESSNTELPDKLEHRRFGGQNTILFREDKNTRSLEASLSDSALQGIGESFTGLFLQRGAVRPLGNAHLFNRGNASIDLKALPVSRGDDASSDPLQNPEVPVPPAMAFSSDQVRIGKIFKATGDGLELVDNRVKATNLSDYVRRLTYLFLYAEECHGRLSVNEHDVVEMLKASKAWDKSGNSRRWLTKRVLIKDEGDEAIKLTGPGREEAIKILDQALDVSVEDKWNPDFNKPKARGNRKKKA